MITGSNQACAVRQVGPLRTADIWFDESLSCPVDIVHFRHVDRPIAGTRCTAEYTLDIDLTADSDALVGAIKERTRTAIHRAKRDEVVTNFWRTPGDTVLQELCIFYNRFAQQKRLPSINQAQLRTLLQSGLLSISNAVAPSGEVLVWHSYVCAHQRARLLHTASLFRNCCSSTQRNAIGRANRYLIFKDMLALKSIGLRVYDFGGWYQGSENIELLRINRFKQEFGGKVKIGYNCELALTPLGKWAVMLKRTKRNLASMLFALSAWVFDSRKW